MHLVIDAYGGDREKMWDEEVVRSFLSEFPSALGMTKLCEPQVLTCIAPKDEDSGVTGFVVIAESHISIHTFPNRDFAYVDVFSCKSFDRDKAYGDIMEIFGFDSADTWDLERGLEFLDRQPVEAASGRGERPAGLPSS